MNIRQVLIRWTTLTGEPGLSVLHFGTEGSLTLLQGGLSNSLAAIDDILHPTTTAAVQPEVRVIDDVTGNLVALEFFGAPPTVTGVSLFDGIVPDAVQGLVRFETNAIVDGRRLRGRSFIPGIAEDNTSGNGEVPASVQAGLNAYGAQLRGGTNTLRVWHRPTATRPGTSFAVQQTSAWSEWAVQRRRR